MDDVYEVNLYSDQDSETRKNTKKEANNSDQDVNDSARIALKADASKVSDEGFHDAANIVDFVNKQSVTQKSSKQETIDLEQPTVKSSDELGSQVLPPIVMVPDAHVPIVDYA